MKTFTINSVNLYDIGTKELEIVNPFDQDVEFVIKIENIPFQEETKRKKKKSKKKSP